MVGVPRSKGCLCDELRPGCQRCQKKGTPCPGYTKDLELRFYSKTPLAAGGEAKPATDQKQMIPSVNISIDGMVAPSLTGKAIAQGYREGFCGFLEANFPGQYYGYSTRVDTNWFDVARKPQETTGMALDWGIRSLGALHIGRSQGNDQLGLVSREMYGQALGQLIRALKRQTLAATEDTLGAAILLGAFEMICSTGQNSWMLHSHGISYLFQARGARTHVQGLGRTLLVSFRGFLVYDALIRRERCFLEDKVWGSIIPDMINEDRRRGKASRLGELIEYAFHEVARCPGFLATTHAQVKSANVADTERESLITSISDCQRALLEYHSEGIAAMNSRQQPLSAEDRDFFGPVPSQVHVTLGEFSLQGMGSAIALLRQLLVTLNSDILRRETLRICPGTQHHPTQSEHDISPFMMKSFESWSFSGNPSLPREHEASHTWFDRVSMMMGMLMDA
ncbi:unnamed protein product [Penicillium pancosmium]